MSNESKWIPVPSSPPRFKSKKSAVKAVSKVERRKIRREVKIYEDLVFRGIKPKSKPVPKRKRDMTQGQLWWRSLSPEEQSAYIADKETSRKSADTSKPLPAPEEFGDGFLKLWVSHDSYKVLKPYMWVFTEEVGYEEVHPDFYDVRKSQLAEDKFFGV